jgi:DNA primase
MAGRIPDTFIDELLARVDIVQVIDARVPLKKKGREYAACCPFHAEKTPSFYVSPRKQFYHCFGCGAHGTAIGFLMEYERLSFPEAVETLAESVGLQVPREAGDTPAARDEAAPLYEALEAADAAFRKALRDSPKAVGYLKGRGLDGATAARYGIGYAPPPDDTLWRGLRLRFPEAVLQRAGLFLHNERGTYPRFRDRITFPIRDRRGRVVGFGARAFGDAQPKYLNSPENALFHKGRLLYGLHECLQRRHHPARILVVEGYMDVCMLARHGIDYAVATLGTATTTEHIDQLYRLTGEVVFCFDGDRAGRAAAWRAAENLLGRFRDGWEARFLFLPQGEDPDSLVRKEGTEAFEGRIAQATPLADYLFEHLAEGLDLGRESARAALAARGRELFARMPESVFRDLLLRRLEKTVGARVRGPDPAAPAAPSRPVDADLAARRPVRWAITLTLLAPEAAARLPDLAPLGSLELPGIDLLLALVETARDNPDIKGGHLAEHFRDHEAYPQLLKLLTHTPPEGFDAGAELQDVVRRLFAMAREQRIEALIRKSREHGLNEDELKELNDLMRTSSNIMGRRTDV